MAEGFTLSRIVIVESLEPHEVATGRILFDFLSSHIADAGPPFKIDLVKCESAIQFKKLTRDLTSRALLYGERPLLHVECHGHSDTGLEFSNGSSMTWDDLSGLLVKLNQATRFNLLAGFSACFGAYMLKAAPIFEQAPFFAVAAPTDAVDPSELMAGFRSFYKTLINSLSLESARAELRTAPLSSGRWLVLSAEEWYVDIALAHVRKHCSRESVKRRALKLQSKAAAMGSELNHDDVVSKIGQVNRSNLLGLDFKTFFMLSMIPENDGRFMRARDHLEAEFSKLRLAGEHVI